MKSKKIALLFLAVSIAANAFAGKKVKHIITNKSNSRISSVSLIAGNSSYNTQNVSTLANFKLLAPNSKLLNIPIANSNNYYNYFNNGGLSNGNTGVLMGINLGGNRKHFRNLELRVGATSNNINFSYYASQQDKYRIDTLKGTNTNTQVFVDSLRNKYLSANYNAKLIGADIALLCKTNDARKFSFYGGLGLNVATLLNASTNIYYSEYSYGNSYSNNNYYQNDTSASENLASTSKTNITNFYIPLGINYKLSKKNYFLKHINLFAETRPTLSIINIQGTNSKLKDITNNGCVGLRISF